MKKRLEVSPEVIEGEKNNISPKRGVRGKTPVRTLEEVMHKASEREHILHQKALAAWEKTSYVVPPSLLKLFKERTKKPEQRESAIRFAEQIKELDAHLHLAECIGKLENGGELREEEREALASAIEQRGWQKMLEDMHAGDTLVSVLVPNDPHVSVKHFNDVVFGPKKTDLIIAYRKEALRQVMEGAGLAVLGQGYKDAYIKIPSGATHDMKKINSLVGEVNRLVNEKILEMLDSARQETQRSGDEKKVLAIQNLKKSLTVHETSYQMTFGISRVGEREREGDYSHIERAIAGSMKGAIVAREERTLESCGLDSDGERARIMEYMTRIQHIRESFIRRGEEGGLQDSKEIRDSQGHSFPIMELRQDGLLQMNLELIRDIRKGKFICEKEDEALFLQIQSYIRLINILDVIKPFVHDELKGGVVYGTKETLQSRVHYQADMVKHLRVGTNLSQDEKEKIATILKSEAKDQTCTSAAEFHKKALEIPDCTYISMDVLDVGPRLLQEFDVLIQRVERGDMTLEEAGVVAGDETTRQMREFRSIVSDTYKNMLGVEDRPLMLVGGDEAILAVKSAQVTDAFLIALREKTGSRVVKSVVGTGERLSAGISDLQKKQEHLSAQERAEQGVDRAKKIERALNTVRLDSESLPRHLQETYEARIRDLHLGQYAVSQRVDDSVLVRKEGRPVSCDVVEEELSAIQKDMTTQFEREVNYLRKKGYAGVDKRNIRLILKTQKQCIQVFGPEQGEAVVEKFLEEHYRT